MISTGSGDFTAAGNPHRLYTRGRAGCVPPPAGLRRRSLKVRHLPFDPGRRRIRAGRPLGGRGSGSSRPGGAGRGRGLRQAPKGRLRPGPCAETRSGASPVPCAGNAPGSSGSHGPAGRAMQAILEKNGKLPVAAVRSTGRRQRIPAPPSSSSAGPAPVPRTRKAHRRYRAYERTGAARCSPSRPEDSNSKQGAVQFPPSRRKQPRATPFFLFALLQSPWTRGREAPRPKTSCFSF